MPRGSSPGQAMAPLGSGTRDRSPARPAPHTAAAARAAAAAGLGLELPADPLTPVAFYITRNSSSSNTLIVFDSRTGRRLAEARIGAGVSQQVAFDRAGDLMLVTGVHETRKSIYGTAQIRRTHGGSAAPDGPSAGRRRLPQSRRKARRHRQPKRRCGDLGRGVRAPARGVRRRTVKAGGQKPGPVSVSFSPNGSLVLTSNSDGRSFVWRPRTGHVVAEMKGDAEPPVGMYALINGAISPDDKLVVVASGWDDDASVYRSARRPRW